MEKDKLEIVLEDILDELKTVNNTMQQHKQQTTELQERVFAFGRNVVDSDKRFLFSCAKQNAFLSKPVLVKDLVVKLVEFCLPRTPRQEMF